MSVAGVAGVAGAVVLGGAAVAGGVFAGYRMGAQLDHAQPSAPIPSVLGKLGGAAGGVVAAGGLAFLAGNAFSGNPQSKGAAVLGAALGAAAVFAIGSAIGMVSSAVAPSS